MSILWSTSLGLVRVGSRISSLNEVGRLCSRRPERPLRAEGVLEEMKGIAEGFLVAFVSRRDMHHDWAIGLEPQLDSPLLTCEAVLAEAAFHLGGASGRPACPAGFRC